MHSWGDESVDWVGINDAAWYIAGWLKTYARVQVRDWKEKFGTVRVYCSFGFDMIYTIWRPGYCWLPKWWPMRLDYTISGVFLPLINRIIVPIQCKLYRWRYKKAVQKWPHLKKEILCCADFPELLKDL